MKKRMKHISDMSAASLVVNTMSNVIDYLGNEFLPFFSSQNTLKQHNLD